MGSFLLGRITRLLWVAATDPYRSFSQLSRGCAITEFITGNCKMGSGESCWSNTIQSTVVAVQTWLNADFWRDYLIINLNLPATELFSQNLRRPGQSDMQTDRVGNNIYFGPCLANEYGRAEVKEHY